MSVPQIFTLVLAVGMASWMGQWMAIIGANETGPKAFSELGQESSEAKSIDSQSALQKRQAPKADMDIYNALTATFSQGADDATSIGPGSQRTNRMVYNNSDAFKEIIGVTPSALANTLVTSGVTSGATHLVAAQKHQPALRALLEKPKENAAKAPAPSPGSSEVKTPKDAVKCQEGHHPDAGGNCDTECPDNTVNKQPDGSGNCECKPEFACFESRIEDQGIALGKELKDPANGKIVSDTVVKDQAGKGPGCPMHPGPLKAGEGAQTAEASQSETFFQLHCTHCKCKPKSSAKAVALPAASFLVLFAMMSF